jgi:hypothetical protein
MAKPDKRHAIIGGRKRAQQRWSMILHRLKGIGPRNKHYANRALEMTQEEFISWFMERDFEGCSVDRIDNTKGYSISNIQLLPLALNMSKDKTRFDGTSHTCSKCKQTKLAENFVKDARRFSGIGSICKRCDCDRKLKQTGV